MRDSEDEGGGEEDAGAGFPGGSEDEDGGAGDANYGYHYLLSHFLKFRATDFRSYLESLFSG